MLSIKYVKVHGMKDDRWTTKDKLNQYRGILKLHARDKRLQTFRAIKLKRKVSRDLKDLTLDVKEYRAIVNGTQRHMHTILQHHKDMQLAYQNAKPAAVYTAAFHDIDVKRKLLDKLYYKKKMKMKEFFDLKLECAILTNKYEREQEYQPDYAQQSLSTQYQQSMAKQNAAKAIRTTYLCMLKILKKDAMYFDAVLDTLKTDQKSQCKVLVKATVMGQLATESLDDTRQRFKQMARDVWSNMRERERTLKVVRGQVNDLWAYAQSLVRVESDTNFTDKKITSTKIEDTLSNQIHDLEQIFEKVKESMLVRSYGDLLPRLEEQMRQKARLLTQFNQNITERDSFLNKKNHALLILATLEHSMVVTTGQYKADKKVMLEQIEIQKKREVDFKNMRKVRGELLMNMRAALQNMVSMLTCIKHGKGARKLPKDADKKSKKEMTEEDGEDSEEKSIKDASPQLEKIEADGLVLLNQVSRKVGMLFGISSFELDKDKEERAKDLYQTYISNYRSELKFDRGKVDQSIFVEHEVVDSSVLTRADIKLRSKQIVEAHFKPE